MKTTTSIYWELTGLMAIIVAALVFAKSLLLDLGLFLPLYILAHSILGYCVINLYVSWRKASNTQRHNHVNV